MCDHDFWEMTFRPVPEPSAALPFGVRSAGRYSVSAPWRESFPGRPFGEFFYGLEGSGTVRLDGENYVLGPGLALAVPPGVAQALKPRSPRWEYAWFTLDGPRSGEVFRWFGLGAGLRGPAVLAPGAFDELRRGLADGTPGGQARSASQAFALLASLAGQDPAPLSARVRSPLVDHALALVRARHGAAGFDVTRLADELGVHRSVLARRFRAELGRTPSEILTDLRIQAARTLLAETHLRVSEVARRSGFADPDYLARVLRKATGLTPTQLRRPSGDTGS